MASPSQGISCEFCAQVLLDAISDTTKILQLTPDHLIAIGDSWGKHSWVPARELVTGMKLFSEVSSINSISLQSAHDGK